MSNIRVNAITDEAGTGALAIGGDNLGYAVSPTQLYIK